MAASEAGQHHQHETNTPSDNLPLVLIHRIPQFDLSYKSWLPATKFRLLDPLDQSFSSTPSAQTLAQSARLLLCLGPSPLTQHTLDRYPSIECVVGSSAGLDHLDLSDCRRRGITVTNAGDAFSDDVADFSVALLLDVLRRVSASNRYVRAGLWPVKGDYPLGSKLGGKQIGIVGLGSIGSRIATRLEAFGCNIAYTSWFQVRGKADRYCGAGKYCFQDCYEAGGLWLQYRLQLKEKETSRSVSVLRKCP